MTKCVRFGMALAALAIGLAADRGASVVVAAQGAPAAISKINLTAGRSTVLTTDFDITRIAVTNPAIADAVVVSPREVLIDGKAVGTISLIVWGADNRAQYDLIVGPTASMLQQQLA